MSWQGNVYAQPQAAPSAMSPQRVAFIRRTYAHLAGALGAFLGLEALLFQTALPAAMFSFIAAGQYNWLMFLGGFIVIGWLARSFAANVSSKPAQYAGLGIYVVAEAIIFTPLILMALVASESGALLMQAAVMTGALFTGLTAVVFFTGKDFSFLRTFLVVGGIVAVGLIVSGAIFGFDLGFAFSAGMIILACAAILYDTSKVIHHFRTDQHVAAALELFASVALLLWYVIQILLRARR